MNEINYQAILNPINKLLVDNGLSRVLLILPTGSYARNLADENSDVDLVVIVLETAQDLLLGNNIRKQIKTEINDKKYDLHVMDIRSLYQQLSHGSIQLIESFSADDLYLNYQANTKEFELANELTDNIFSIIRSNIQQTNASIGGIIESHLKNTKRKKDLAMLLCFLDYLRDLIADRPLNVDHQDLRSIKQKAEAMSDAEYLNQIKRLDTAWKKLQKSVKEYCEKKQVQLDIDHRQLNLIFKSYFADSLPVYQYLDIVTTSFKDYTGDNIKLDYNIKYHEYYYDLSWYFSDSALTNKQVKDLDHVISHYAVDKCGNKIFSNDLSVVLQATIAINDLLYDWNNL